MILQDAVAAVAHVSEDDPLHDPDDLDLESCTQSRTAFRCDDKRECMQVLKPWSASRSWYEVLKEYKKGSLCHTLATRAVANLLSDGTVRDYATVVWGPGLSDEQAADRLGMPSPRRVVAEGVAAEARFQNVIAWAEWIRETDLDSLMYLSQREIDAWFKLY